MVESGDAIVTSLGRCGVDLASTAEDASDGDPIFDCLNFNVPRTRCVNWYSRAPACLGYFFTTSCTT